MKNKDQNHDWLVIFALLAMVALMVVGASWTNKPELKEVKIATDPFAN